MGDLPNECPGCGKPIYLQATKRRHIPRCDGINDEERERLLTAMDEREQVMADD